MRTGLAKRDADFYIYAAFKNIGFNNEYDADPRKR
jgi:hypothetical protein